MTAVSMTCLAALDHIQHWRRTNLTIILRQRERWGERDNCGSYRKNSVSDWTQSYVLRSTRQQYATISCYRGGINLTSKRPERTLVHTGRTLDIKAAPLNDKWHIAVFEGRRKVSRDYTVSHETVIDGLAGPLSINLIEHLMDGIEKSIMGGNEPLLP